MTPDGAKRNSGELLALTERVEGKFGSCKQEETMSFLRTVVIAASILISSSCFAQSISSVMKEYGVLGTWSLDCASSVEKGADRITFDAPTFGSATITELTSGGRIIISNISEVRAAERITQDKIRLTVVLTKFHGSAGPLSIPASDDREKPKQFLFEKIGQKISFQGVLLLEKCLN